MSYPVISEHDQRASLCMERSSELGPYFSKYGPRFRASLHLRIIFLRFAGRQVIKNPVEAHLPTGARRIGTSKTGKLIKANEWVKTLPSG